MRIGTVVVVGVQAAAGNQHHRAIPILVEAISDHQNWILPGRGRHRVPEIDLALPSSHQLSVRKFAALDPPRAIEIVGLVSLLGIRIPEEGSPVLTAIHPRVMVRHEEVG